MRPEREATGGQRSYHYQNCVDDILAVVTQYFIDDPEFPGGPNPDMKSQTDRTAIIGGNAWNLGPPNGQQRVDDILAQVKQYFHDCYASARTQPVRKGVPRLVGGLPCCALRHLPGPNDCSAVLFLVGLDDHAEG